MKKIMILGGNPETAVLVNTALSMGYYTIVVDMGHGSPAKKNASESYDIDVFEVDKIVELARERNVDAVLVGVADILVKPYREICEKLGVHCYATEKAVEAFSSKDGPVTTAACNRVVVTGSIMPDVFASAETVQVDLEPVGRRAEVAAGHQLRLERPLQAFAVDQAPFDQRFADSLGHGSPIRIVSSARLNMGPRGRARKRAAPGSRDGF